MHQKENALALFPVAQKEIGLPRCVTARPTEGFGADGKTNFDREAGAAPEGRLKVAPDEIQGHHPNQVPRGRLKLTVLPCRARNLARPRSGCVCPGESRI